jgi:dolichol kinase
MLSYTSINIGPPCNLYSAVGSGSVSSWLFAPPYWRRFFHVNLCLFYSLTSCIKARVRHIVFINIVAAAVEFCYLSHYVD